MTDPRPGRLFRWIEILGLLGVVASLVFVGLEIRQNTAIARAEAYREFVSEVNQINLAALDDVVAGALTRHYQQGVPYEELTGVERSKWLFIMTAYFRTYEGLYEQVQTGVLDAGAFRLVEGVIRDEPATRFAWLVQREAVSPAFRSFIEERHPFLSRPSSP